MVLTTADLRGTPNYNIALRYLLLRYTPLVSKDASAPNMVSQIQSGDHFSRAISSKPVVVVDFFATW